MSKVIKSSSVQIQSPRVVDHYSELPLVIVGEASEVPEEQEEPVDIPSLKEQAGQILAETEAMVRELIETARSEADKIIKSAHEEARRIVSEGREQVRRSEDEAVQKGRQTGFDEGAAKAEDEYRSQLQEADRVLEAAREEYRQILAGAESDIINLVVAVAKKIIGREATNPEVILNIVQRAVQKATDREDLTIRVNPENLDTALNGQDDIVDSVRGIRKLKIIADSAVSAGGCVVETPNGTVDARIERQIAEINEALMEVSAE